MLFLEDGLSSNESQMACNKQALDKFFGTWDSPGDGGYRTTPDNWRDDVNKELNCTGRKEQCASDGISCINTFVLHSSLLQKRFHRHLHACIYKYI